MRRSNQLGERVRERGRKVATEEKGCMNMVTNRILKRGQAKLQISYSFLRQDKIFSKQSTIPDFSVYNFILKNFSPAARALKAE